MSQKQDQISQVAVAGMETQLSRLNALNQTLFHHLENLFDLNINLVRTSLDEFAVISRQVLAAKDGPEFFSLMVSLAKPNAEKALSYGRHLANIASAAQAEITKATQEQLADANREMSKLVESAAKDGPAGSENMVALVKSVIDNASSGYEQLNKTALQAAEAIEASIGVAPSQMPRAAEKAGK